MTVIVLENASVLDPDRGTLLPDHSIVVCDDRVTEVAPGPEVRVSEPDRAIDVRGRVVMPGLIDAHVHVYLQSLDVGRLASWLPSYLVPKAAVALRDMLRRGFTTVRDTGGADFALARAVADGLIEGPRLIFGDRRCRRPAGTATPANRASRPWRAARAARRWRASRTVRTSCARRPATFCAPAPIT